MIQRKGLKTYSHLGGARRMPREYELVSSRLLYHLERGFEPSTELGQRYMSMQAACPLRCGDWERFSDPRSTTYASYTTLQHEQETYVGGLLESIERSEYDAQLSREWLAELELLLLPARYPIHGLQMLAAYVGQMAPSGRIVITAAFQAADEMRRIQRIAYRMAQLRMRFRSFGDRSRSDWECHPAWQPLRRLLEHMLLIEDFCEAFAALNLCFKPCFDAFLMLELGSHARGRGDPLLAEVLAALHRDCVWHEQWALALARMLSAEDAKNCDRLRGWLQAWQPRIEEALGPLLNQIDAGAQSPGAWTSERLVPISAALEVDDAVQ